MSVRRWPHEVRIMRYTATVRRKPDTTDATVRLKPDTTYAQNQYAPGATRRSIDPYVVSGFSRSATWIVAIACVLMVACARPGSESPSPVAPASTAALRPLTLPDLSHMDAAVQEQMRATHVSLTTKIGEARPPGELAEAYGEMGSLLLAAEYFDAAEPCFLNAQALAPRDSRWPYYLGHVYRTRGEPANAARAFEQALALGPPDVATLVWLGVAYLDQGKPESAARLFERALAIEPRSVAAWFGQGRAALASREYGRAAASFEQALAIDPRASIVHYPLALAYRGLGEVDKAEAQTRQRGNVEVGPTDPRMQALGSLLHSATAYEKRGLRALDGRDWASAAAAFRKAVEIAPANATLHHRFGTALSLSGDTRGAAEQFQEAIRLVPGYAPAHFSLGVLLASSGRPAEAIERFAAAVRYEPDNADARLQLAAALVRAGRYQEARNQLVEGARLNPERAEFTSLLQQFRPTR